MRIARSWRAKAGLADFMRKLVGDNCARLRAERGWTQEELAERSGLSQQYLSDLERGKRNPTIVPIYEIAVAFEVSHVELVIPKD